MFAVERQESKESKSSDVAHERASARDGEHGRWHPGDMDIRLEPEFYTAAFVSPLHLHQSRQGYERVCGETFFTIGMLAVACMQCLTVFGMSSYLAEKDSGYMDEFKLGTGLFATGGATMSATQAQDLCGTFNHIGLHRLTGNSSIAMPDGTTFEGTPDMPMFHSYKMPSGAWTFHSIGGDESYIDKQLRVVHDVNLETTASYFRNFRVEYGVLLVIMVGWLWYHVLYELRKIMNFSFVLYHFRSKGFVKDSNGTTELDANTGAITITNLTFNAFVVGSLSVILRVTVALMMLVWGTTLLTASWNKLSLVLNSLAIGIVFELDVIIAYAVIDHNTMQRIESIEPIRVDSLRNVLNFSYRWDIFFSCVAFVAVFVGAMFVRMSQVHNNTQQLHNAAALCLFAGPTPQAREDIIAPVPGFCESLLSLTCAPKVTGGKAEHGPCLVTDQNIFQNRSVMLYASENLFDNMYDDTGKRQSMADWGNPSPKLAKTETWVDDRNLNLFRRVCTQLYHPEGQLENRIVDRDRGLKMYSAPFYCPREQLFQAIFGDVQKGFSQWSSKLDLESDKIVAALDRCRDPAAKTQDAPTFPAASAPAPVPAPAPGPEAAFAPVSASSNLLRVSRHHAHHQHHKLHHEVKKHHKRHHEVSRQNVLRSGADTQHLHVKRRS